MATMSHCSMLVETARNQRRRPDRLTDCRPGSPNKPFADSPLSGLEGMVSTCSKYYSTEKSCSGLIWAELERRARGRGVPARARADLAKCRPHAMVILWPYGLFCAPRGYTIHFEGPVFPVPSEGNKFVGPRRLVPKPWRTNDQGVYADRRTIPCL
jgi:hypothetical protein